ncbi:MAG: isopenicillin-N epimerase [Planctomycetota bacterium]|nr:MAG: isopenicillin-N epimerase [Planctomycetota bacterium]
MLGRRDFLRWNAAAAGALLLPATACRAVAAFSGDTRSPEDIARDESLWVQVQQSFSVDRSALNLNNGGVSPAPRLVQDAVKRHLDFSHQLPVHNMNRVLWPQAEAVRERMAAAWGVDSGEIALMRNASEALQTVQLGLDLQPGDEVLTSTHDYPRMITAFQQRERRDGIVLKQIEMPVPMTDQAALVELYRAAITPATKLLLVCHITPFTGQVLPVKEIVAMAREHGVPTLIDGAHSFAHLDFNLAELDCDYFATSLHKWLHAPHGTGLLYVRREKIRELWPLMAAREEQENDIRKFEEIGTASPAPYLGIAEALSFHEGIGGANKEARLRHLRDLWAEPLLDDPRVSLYTSRDEQLSCGIATLRVEGMDMLGLYNTLWRRHRIVTSPINRDDVLGLRISPSISNTPQELERFVRVVREHLPA